MLNIKGAFVLIGVKPPIPVLISESAYVLYMDRIRVAGIDKADAYTFGHDVVCALPCTGDCMEFIALNYVGAHQDAVRRICARIALGEPLGTGKDITEDGGQPARIDAPVTNPKAPAGVPLAVGALS
jgi:hypothetical protein